MWYHIYVQSNNNTHEFINKIETDRKQTYRHEGERCGGGIN